MVPRKVLQPLEGTVGSTEPWKLQKQPEVGMFNTVGSTGFHLKMKSVGKMVSDFLLAEPPDLTLHYNAPD